MIIDIIGAGSLGLLLAGKLIHAGARIRIWCRSSEQSEALKKEGLTVSYEDGTAPVFIPGKEIFAAPASSFADTVLREPGDWLVITLKQQAFHEKLPEMLFPLKNKSLQMVCFQNGCGHLERLQELMPYASIWAAVTTEAAKRKTLTKVIHAGSGETWIGKGGFGGASPEPDIPVHAPAVISLVDTLLTAGFSASVSKEVNTMIYRKLLINAVINPLTAVWRIQNGELLASEQRLLVMKELYAEAITVFDACGIEHEESAWDSIIEVCRATSGNISSMLADVLSSRATEIRWINGSIVDLAERRGIQVPLHRWICQLVEGMSARER
ncbi:ketopantoate reductase family protein [Paenibacillus tianjinensis]|uniref:2-dehydropantoate 2-reductase n=1 Tax=Paenibacillus tianjinensis TaxID=2810347 RepID=A0ABX7LAT3_9BACL|nr:ketopantoate reductase family protein [Paenibacillus tianjinensis]QSF43873.1 ketopantoate reductase family protein [Paenibacillus tianjinensis]